MLKSLDIQTLQRAYETRQVTALEVVRAVYARIAASQRKGVWIQLVPETVSLELAKRLDSLLAGGSSRTLPLFGIPFAIKDNIDLQGLPTTAACPDFAYTPERSATVVEKLIAAGAIPIGKTNLDQFATGLVGVRSPYGACENAFDARYISGGSSSGSAVAVALGQVSFALGTDTAGSGRVPAAFNNVIGLKPTKGLLSTRGVVPACRSLDCVSIFALTCGDTSRVFKIARGFDTDALYSRVEADVPLPENVPLKAFTFGVPQTAQLQTFENADYATLFERANARLVELGGKKVEIDFSPFREAAELLYSGPWVAERWVALKDFLIAHPQSMFPVTKTIVSKGANFSAADAFEAQYTLEDCRRRALREWKKMNVLLTPTASALYTIEAVNAEPVALNSRLGYYTNYVNLLDCCALALPAGFDDSSLPFGVTLIAPAYKDGALAELGARYHRIVGGHLGATSTPFSAMESEPQTT